MQEVIMLRGLPGSGKTTWAREYMQDKNWVRRISKDDIRTMIGGEYSRANEDTVIAIRNAIMDTLLFDGYWVIVDDTNLNNRHLVAIQNLCSKYDATVRWQEFDTPIDECIRRDALRPHPVGAARIREMYERWRGPQVSIEEMRKAMGM